MAVVVEMTGKEESLWRATQKIIKQQQELERGYTKVGKAAKKTGKKAKAALDPMHLNKFIGGLVGVGGITAALTQVNQGYEIWLANIREIADEAKKAADQIVALAALQRMGEKRGRIMEAMGLGAFFGITDRNALIDTIQAIQSARPELTWEQVLQAVVPILQATQLKMSLPTAKEAEVIGASLGQDPGQTIRQAYVAGKLSARDPEMIAKAAPGMLFWENKELAFAAAAVLSGPYGLRTEAHLRAAGIALSGTSKLAPMYEQLGVGTGSELEKLQALKAAGIDTAEELTVAGLGEMRRIAAMALLIQNLPNVERIAQGIREQAVPGILFEERRAVEAEIPEAAAARRINMLDTKLANEMALGDAALRALNEEEEQKIRGLAFRRMGWEEGLFGRDLISPEGKATKWSTLWAYLGDLAGRQAYPLQPGESLVEQSYRPRPMRDLGKYMRAIALEQEAGEHPWISGQKWEPPPVEPWGHTIGDWITGDSEPPWTDFAHKYVQFVDQFIGRLIFGTDLNGTGNSDHTGEDPSPQRERQIKEQEKTNALLERFLDAVPPGTYGAGI